MFNGTDASVHAMFRTASEESRRLGHGFVESEHLLLAAGASRARVLLDWIRGHITRARALAA